MSKGHRAIPAPGRSAPKASPKELRFSSCTLPSGFTVPTTSTKPLRRRGARVERRRQPARSATAQGEMQHALLGAHGARVRNHRHGSRVLRRCEGDAARSPRRQPRRAGAPPRPARTEAIRMSRPPSKLRTWPTSATRRPTNRATVAAFTRGNTPSCAAGGIAEPRDEGDSQHCTTRRGHPCTWDIVARDQSTNVKRAGIAALR